MILLFWRRRKMMKGLTSIKSYDYHKVFVLKPGIQYSKYGLCHANENEVLFNFLTISWHRNIFWLYWKAWLLEDISVLAPIDIHKVLLLPWKVSGKRKHTMFHKMCSYKNNSARTWKLCLLYVYHHIKTFFLKT